MKTGYALQRVGLLAFAISALLLDAPAAEESLAPPTKRIEKIATDSMETPRLDPVTVEAARMTNDRVVAMNVQLSATNITSVVSTTEFGPLVDSNPGEFLKYLPGVDVEPVAPGFFRYSVHGLGADNTEILFDGLPLANMHGDRDAERPSRRFDVSLVSTADIASAEVRKLPLPSDSANSLGGTINLVRRSAFESSRRRVTYQTWLRSDAQKLTDEPLPAPGGQRLARWRPNWQIIWTEPVRRDFGFSVALGQEDLLLSTQFASPGWNLGTAASNSAAQQEIAAGRGVPDAVSIFNPALTSAVLLDAPQRQRKDYALARFDWRPRPELVINAELGVHDSRQSDTQALYLWNVALAGSGDVVRDHDATHTFGRPAGGSAGHNSELWREATTVTTTTLLAAKWTKDAWEMNAKAGWSKSGSDLSDTSNGFFGSTSVGSVPGLVDIPQTGVGFQTANPLSLMLDFRHRYWGLTEVDAWTTATGLKNSNAAAYNVPVAWQSNEVVRIGGARSRPARAEEIITSAKVFAKRKFEFTAPTSVQLGVDWSERFRSRRQGYDAWRFVGADGIPNSPDDSATLIGAGRESARRDPTYGYPEPESISMSKLYQVFQEHPAWFRYDAAHSERLALTTNSAYDLKERVTAPYLEFETTRIGRRLRLTGGVRYERTTAKARGLLADNGAAFLHYADGTTVHLDDTNPASIRPDGRLVMNLGTSTAVNYVLVNGPALIPTSRTGSPVFTADIQAAGNAARAAGGSIDTDTNLGRGTLAHTRAVYHAKGATNEAGNHGWFPSLHATYDFSDTLMLQAGYARTQGRIDYATALLPNNEVTDDLITSGDGAGAIGRITLQNPNLQPWTADNFEARLSWNFGRGLIALGGFRKQVRNFQPQIDTPPLSASDLANYAKLFPNAGLGPEYEGYTLRYRTNAGAARLDGAEVEFRAPLDAWLPSWTRGFDLTGAASYLNRTGANGDELGLNRAWIGSANIRYAAGRLAIRVGYRFNGAQVISSQVISNDRTGQTIREPQQLVDATIDYAISRWVRVFVAGTNLTNALSVDEQRFRDKPAYANLTSSRNIGTTCAVGLAGTF